MLSPGCTFEVKSQSDASRGDNYCEVDVDVDGSTKRQQNTIIVRKIDKQNGRRKATDIFSKILRSSTVLVYNGTDDLACIILNTLKNTVKAAGDKLLMNKFIRQNFGGGRTLKTLDLNRLGAYFVET